MLANAAAVEDSGWAGDTRSTCTTSPPRSACSHPTPVSCQAAACWHPAPVLDASRRDRPDVRELIGQLLEINALHRLRSAQGVIGLADRHGVDRLDAACRRAIEVGDPSYRTVKGILVAGTEHADRPAAGPPAAPAHLHGQAALFAAISTGEAVR